MPRGRSIPLGLVGRARARHWVPALLVALSSLALSTLALSQSAPASPFAITPPSEVIDPRYEATLRELVATPSGRAFLEALQLIEREYLYATDREALLRGATAGLIAALDDPYSRYLAPDVVAARRAGEMPEAEVHAVMLGDVGYVQIRDFDGEAVGVRVGRAIDAHLANGALGLVLDLRGNDGGSILQGLQVLDRFLADGVLGFRRVRGVSIPIAYANPRSVTKPLVVLVDGNTASTAEIVAGALQAYGRAKIVGTVTAGKGIGQSAIELSDGSEIHLVSFEWLLPGFRSIDGTGLRPDVEIALGWPTDDDDADWEVQGIHDAVTDPALRAALELLREVVGDELSALLTAPAPTPQVGPTMVPLPTEVDEPPPADEQPPDPESSVAAPPVAPATPGDVSDPGTPPGTAIPGTAPPPTPPFAVEPFSPPRPGDGGLPGSVNAVPPVDETAAVDEAPAADDGPRADDARAADDDVAPADDEARTDDDRAADDGPAADDDGPRADDARAADDDVPVDDDVPLDDELPVEGDPQPEQAPSEDGPPSEGETHPAAGDESAASPEVEERGAGESPGARRARPIATARSRR